MDSDISHPSGGREVVIRSILCTLLMASTLASAFGKRRREVPVFACQMRRERRKPESHYTTSVKLLSLSETLE